MTGALAAREVAEWMLKQLDEQVYLYQESVVYDIYAKFGEEFIYYNENGNLAIDRAVLKEFKKLSGDEVVWCRGDRYWRRRELGDEPGRLQS